MQTVLTQSDIAKAIAAYMKVFKGQVPVSVKFEADFRQSDSEDRLRAFVTIDDTQKLEPMAFEDIVVKRVA